MALLRCFVQILCVLQEAGLEGELLRSVRVYLGRATCWQTQNSSELQEEYSC